MIKGVSAHPDTPIISQINEKSIIIMPFGECNRNKGHKPDGTLSPERQSNMWDFRENRRTDCSSTYNVLRERGCKTYQ